MVDIKQKTLVEKIIDLEKYTETALTQSSYVRNQRFLLCADIRKAISEILHLADAYPPAEKEYKSRKDQI